MNIRLRLSFLTFLLSLPFLLKAQTVDSVVTPSMQMDMLSYIAADDARGRAAGTPANRYIADYIKGKFVEFGLDPYTDGQYYCQFRLDDKHLGRNVAAIVPARRKTDKYVVISAHFDHMGSLNGYTYNGADDNASGVTTLLSLAKIFSVMRNTGYKPRYNLIFVAFDAKEKDMKGSVDFVNRLTVPKENIFCNINLDQIGTSLQPVHNNGRPFIIILGRETLPEEKRFMFDQVNALYNLNFDIDYTFYNSTTFAGYVYKTSDQIVFHKAGIPALLFTSGFTDHTYKTTDDIGIIDFDMLYRRTMLLYYIILNL